MGIKDIVNAGKIKKENDNLKELLRPEMQDAAKLAEYVSRLAGQKDTLEKEILRLSETVEKLKKDTIFFEDALVYQDFGLYTPRYNFVTAEEYRLKLEKVRTVQKDMIKNDTAISGSKTWTVDGSRTKGAKMITDLKKLFLRAFNSDCEDVISKVKYSNYEMSVKKIRQSAESIEKLGKMMSLFITARYINAKIPAQKTRRKSSPKSCTSRNA